MGYLWCIGCWIFPTINNMTTIKDPFSRLLKNGIFVLAAGYFQQLITVAKLALLLSGCIRAEHGPGFNPRVEIMGCTSKYHGRLYRYRFTLKTSSKLGTSQN